MSTNAERFSLDEAIEMVKAMHEKAVKRNEDAAYRGYGPVVFKPVAWALYNTWRIADGSMPDKDLAELLR